MSEPQMNLGDYPNLSCMQHVYFFQFTGCLVNIFSFRFSSVLNLPESSTLLLSANRLHGKQDKPVGDKHMNCEKGEQERTIRKI